MASGYRLAMLEMAQMRRLDLWYLRLEVDEVAERVRATMKPDVVKRFERNVAKARAKDSAKAFAKLVEVVDGQPRFVGDPPLIVPLGQLLPDVEHQRLWEVLRGMMRSYRRSLQSDHRHLLEGFHFVEAARKVVGVGSVGTRAWVVLMMGNGADDPLFLQLKEAQSSVLEPFLGKEQARQPRATGRGRSTTDAVRERHPARLDPGRRAGRRTSRLLRPAAVGRQGIGDDRGHEALGDAGLCGPVWMDAGTRARAFR